jgi:hypothetical protein
MVINITIFGWDTSHYDDPPTYRDGIDFFTHKCAEGHHFYKDAEYAQSSANARGLGIPLLGAYFVNHGGTIQDQVDWFVSIVTTETPWWKDVNWMWQIDAEKFEYMSRAPTIDEINGFGDLLQNQTNVPANSIFAYAPPWLYGSSLSGLKYPHWSSNYGGNPAVPYRQAYPGDSSSRWNPFTGSEVVILQYGSNTIIGNQTTCDANAYRGTLEQLLRFVLGVDSMTQDEFNNLWLGLLRGTDIKSETIKTGLRAIPWQYIGGGIPTGMSTLGVLNQAYLNAKTAAEKPPVDVAALAAAIVALLPPSTLTKSDVETACISALTHLGLTVTP